MPPKETNNDSTSGYKPKLTKLENNYDEWERSLKNALSNVFYQLFK